jgi:FtsZ-binding cell division protein ZapB
LLKRIKLLRELTATGELEDGSLTILPAKDYVDHPAKEELESDHNMVKSGYREWQENVVARSVQM